MKSGADQSTRMVAYRGGRCPAAARRCAISRARSGQESVRTISPRTSGLDAPSRWAAIRIVSSSSEQNLLFAQALSGNRTLRSSERTSAADKSQPAPAAAILRGNEELNDAALLTTASASQSRAMRSMSGTCKSACAGCACCVASLQSSVSHSRVV